MKRNQQLKTINNSKEKWDLIVIGGGSTGLGVALDAVSRNLRVLLIDKSDFAKGTSSKSTKLLHGGVRYLANGSLGLVFEALKERGIILKNANHITKKLPFIIPIYNILDLIKYFIGLKLYDWMSGKLSLGKSCYVSKTDTLKKIPSLNPKNLIGGIKYYDGQFDDARLAIDLVKTINNHGGIAINYIKVNKIIKNELNIISGLEIKDQISKDIYNIKAKIVVNATGVFSDQIITLDNNTKSEIIQPSQGVHIVLPEHFKIKNEGLMIPKTSDGRVLFLIPWKGKILVGTTDNLVKKASLNPKANDNEINFIIETVNRYITPKVEKKDILSVFTGLRPLAKMPNKIKAKEISRSHKIIISKSKLVSIIGGKWTTFRKMGEDVLDLFQTITGEKIKSTKSKNIKIHGHTEKKINSHLSIYGSDYEKIHFLLNERRSYKKKLHPKYPYLEGEVVWAIRNEMAITLEDIMCRRIGLFFIDTQASKKIASKVASIMKIELKKDDEWMKNELMKFKKLI